MGARGIVVYQGTDDRGIPRRGAVAASELYELVEGAFRRGWKRLQVKDSATGEVVGAVGTVMEGGPRTWWAGV